MNNQCVRTIIPVHMIGGVSLEPKEDERGPPSIGGRIAPNPYPHNVASGLDRMDCHVTYRFSGPKAKGRTRCLY